MPLHYRHNNTHNVIYGGFQIQLELNLSEYLTSGLLSRASFIRGWSSSTSSLIKHTWETVMRHPQSESNINISTNMLLTQNPEVNKAFSCNNCNNVAMNSYLTEMVKIKIHTSRGWHFKLHKITCAECYFSILYTLYFFLALFINYLFWFQ